MSLLFFVFVFGLLWGSFFNVCITRMPREKYSLLGRSRCDSCHGVIPAKFNIPVLSYFFLKGKCHHCGASFSIQYPIVEFLTGWLFVSLYYDYGLGFDFLLMCAFFGALLVVSVIDIHHRIIPNEISLPGIVLGWLAALYLPNITILESFIGSLVGGGSFLFIAWLYEKYAGREGLGGGDVKLMAMIGAWLGVQNVLYVIMISSTLGAVTGVILMVGFKKNLQAAIPFGPYLSVAAFLVAKWTYFWDKLLKI